MQVSNVNTAFLNDVEPQLVAEGLHREGILTNTATLQSELWSGLWEDNEYGNHWMEAQLSVM